MEFIKIGRLLETLIGCVKYTNVSSKKGGNYNVGFAKNFNNRCIE